MGDESDCEDEFEVERIVDHVTVSGKKYYRVRWKNYTESGDTWEPYEHLLSCEDLLKGYIKAHNLSTGEGSTSSSQKNVGSTDSSAASKSNRSKAKENKKRKTKKQKDQMSKTEESVAPPISKSNVPTKKIEEVEMEPKVKDRFWDDLENGKINVFASDLYSSVKKRRKATLNVDYTNSTTIENKPTSSDKKKRNRKPRQKEKSVERERIIIDDDTSDTESEKQEPEQDDEVKTPEPEIVRFDFNFQNDERSDEDEIVEPVKESDDAPEPTTPNPKEDKEIKDSKPTTGERSAFQMLMEESESGLSKEQNEANEMKAKVESPKEEQKPISKSTSSSSLPKTSSDSRLVKSNYEKPNNSPPLKKEKEVKQKIQDVDFLKTSLEKQKENKFKSKKSKDRLSHKNEKRKKEQNNSLFDKLSNRSSPTLSENNKSTEKPKPQVDMSEFMNRDTELKLSQITLRDVERHHLSGDTTSNLVADISNAEFRIYIRNNNYDMINEALKSKRMIYNLEHTDSTWMTLLMVASAAGSAEVVRLLCHHGARVNARSKTGQTALMYASEKGHELVVKALILYGAYVNMITSNGETALMKASKSGYGLIVRHLLLHGADPFTKSVHGSSAVDFAENKANSPIVQLIQTHQTNLSRCVQSCVFNMCTRLGIKLLGQPVILVQMCNMRETTLLPLQFNSNAIGIGANQGLLLFCLHGMIGSNLSVKCRMRGPCFVVAVTINNIVMDAVMPDAVSSSDETSKESTNYFITNLVWKHGVNNLKLFLTQDAGSSEKLFVTAYIATIADI